MSLDAIEREQIHRLALEMAADLLMDHGVIRTGHELEQVCEQIRKLPLPPRGARRIEVVVQEIEVMMMNSPRDSVIGLLRSKGIPALPGPKYAMPTDFGQSIRVERGWLEHSYDLARMNHRFRWDEEAPF